MLPHNEDLLFEVGTEELPARSLTPLVQQLAHLIVSQLQTAQLSYQGRVKAFATPRRLSILIEQLERTQPTQAIERRGPALTAAYDEAGQPTPACIGFAKTNGVEVSALQKLKTDKGEWVVYRGEQAGLSVYELIPAIITTAFKKLSLPRQMRWGDGSYEFLRPVRWFLLMYGQEIIPAQIFGLNSDRKTHGHRFHAPEALTIHTAGDYQQRLKQEGFVIADIEQRKEKIKEQIAKIEQEVSGSVIVDEDLLNEVTALVEWPMALCARFTPDFLKLPSDVLITSMKHHQKSFAIRKKNKDELLAFFVTIANLDSQMPEQVIKGNERVMQARLSDAQFFYETDQKTPLTERVKSLSGIVVNEKLGTLYDKAKRLELLALLIAEELNKNLKNADKLSEDLISRAALLAKTDLVTDMVGEFPELQGIMGYHYYRDEHEGIATAIREQYLPRFSGDALPATSYGMVLALADRCDHLYAYFAIGQEPTADKDPFALRRAALGIIRILVEKHIPLSLSFLFGACGQVFKQLQAIPTNKEMLNKIRLFLNDRQRAWCLERNIAPEVYEAVAHVENDIPYDMDLRMQAVQEFLQLPQAQSLATANKRVVKILAAAFLEQDNINEKRLELPAEQALYHKMMATDKEIADQKDYQKILFSLASLQNVIDQFFDEVFVMSENKDFKQNRLCLLKKLRQLFLTVADISLLPG